MKCLCCLLGLVAITWASTPSSARAQGTERADLIGSVVDSSGAAVPGTTLTVTNIATKAKQTTVSDHTGHYGFRFLPAGRYSLVAELSGFASVTVTGIVLQVNDTVTVPIELKPAKVMEAITVEARTNAPDASNATAKFTVTNEQVRGLPVVTSILGRNVLDQLAFLVPGVTPAPGGGGGERGEGISINGSRPSSVAYNFEGGDNNDHENNRAASPMPNPDALQEFTVVTNNYQADLGRSSGGVINATTRSGTETYHGTLRDYIVNEALNARGFFDPVRPRRRLNTFGGNLGGVLFLPGYSGRGRTHFFVDFEGTRSSRESLFNRPLLSAAERTGDFGSLPASQWPIDPRTGQPFQNGMISSDRINSISRLYVDRYIPPPDDGERNYRQFLPTDDDNNQVTVRIDHTLTKASTLAGTYFITKSVTHQSSTTNIPIGSHQDSISSNHNVVVRENHVFSPKMVNQLTGAFTYYQADFRFFTPDADGVHPRDLGFTGVSPQTDIFLAPPSVVISGTGVQFSTGGGFTGEKYTWQVKDDLSWTLGAHALKVGAEARGYSFDKALGNNNGSFGFAGTNTFGTRNAIADFLLGIPNSYSQSTGNLFYPRQNAYYGYAMDDWRLGQNVTLNLGLRYELVPPLVDKLDQMGVFRPGAQSQKLPQAPLGLLFPGDKDPALGTVPRGGYPTDKNNFAPRFGIAWLPRPSSGILAKILGNAHSAIRAGGGVFYDQTYGFAITQLSFTQPFSVTQSLNAASIAGAGGTFANPWGSSPNPWPLDLSERTFTGTPQLQPVSPDFTTAYTYQYNVTWQRQLPWALLGEIGYVGNVGRKLNRERELNEAIVGPGATTSNVQQRRIYPYLGSIPQQESTGRSRFDSLQLRLVRRFRGGLMFDTSYVRGRAYDDGSNPQVSQLVITDPNRWARSNYDRRHQFVISYTYHLPQMSGDRLLARVVNGWEIGGITQYRTGTPLDISQTGDTTLTGRTLNGRGNPDLVGPFQTFDPRQVQTIVVNGVPRTGNFFFDPTAFAVVTVTDYTQARAGTLTRNVFDGPKVTISSMSIVKRTRIHRSHSLDIRADITNLLNQTQWGFPGLIAGSSNFGMISSAGPGREIQMSVRYTF